MKERCGNCQFSKNENIEGYAWCEKLNQEIHCSFKCHHHKLKNNGWTELTNDNKHELADELLHRIVIGFIDKRGRMYAMTLIDCRLGIGEMANLGGFYYYVLPELKIE